ncbi:keratin, type I cytoskeletal 9-like [Chenopodium quinoa]|uniref:keratin, type I cytoskeletal 9-like n=1 Tax=Chenopodium quinoa TaxID=63459 RepID=UPI000B780C99|nr:keratin, type I cytoskeletal 9-like [Chenopodium quinoa]
MQLIYIKLDLLYVSHIALEGQVQRGEFIAKGRDDILAKAMHKREHGGSVRAVGSGITVKDYFGYNKPAPPSQLHAEIGMMKSKLVSMDNRQNFMMSFLMSCCSQEQIKSFMAVGAQQVGVGGLFGGNNTSGSLNAGFGGLTAGCNGLTAGLHGFCGLTGGLGGFSGLTCSLAGGSSGLGVGLTGGFGGLTGGFGGQASGSNGPEGGSSGLAGGLEGGSSGLAGDGSRASQLDDTFGQGLQGADIYGTQGNREEDIGQIDNMVLINGPWKPEVGT